MTRVGFYVLRSAEPVERLRIAMRLTEKAFQQGHRVFLNARSRKEAEQLDDELWSFRPASFLPHGLSGQEDAQCIAIGWGQDPGEHGDLLINLQLEVPPFFSRFRRVAEVVTQDPESLAALRTSYQFYRDRGYQLEKHDL
jgi:DNA polymerase-3 subunit chi